MRKFYTGSLKFVGLLTQDKTVIKGNSYTGSVCQVGGNEAEREGVVMKGENT
jgi:hypothetical protein